MNISIVKTTSLISQRGRCYSRGPLFFFGEFSTNYRKVFSALTLDKKYK